MIPEDWKRETVADLCDFINGNGFKPSDWSEHGLPIIRIQNLNGSSDFNYFSGTPKKTWLVHNGDILFAWAGTKGVSFGAKRWHGLTGVLNQHIFRVVPKIAVDVDWLYLAMLTVTQRVENKAHGFKATLLHVQKSDITDQTLDVPPIPEQKKIAQILSTWDKAITTTEQLLANSQQQKKALMQQLLTGKKRLNGFGGEWRRLRLSHCAICLDNKRVPLNSEQRSSMLGSIPYWGANGVVDHINDFIFDQTIVMLAEDGGYFDEYETRSIANISHGKCWVNNHAHILVAKDNCLNEWLYYSLVHKNILAFVNGGTRAKLNKSDMLQILINLPDIEEQQAIVAVLSAADREIELLQQKLEGLKQEKKALMQQLLTGKRRVQA